MKSQGTAGTDDLRVTDVCRSWLQSLDPSAVYFTDALATLRNLREKAREKQVAAAGARLFLMIKTGNCVVRFFAIFKKLLPALFTTLVPISGEN